MEFNTDLNYIGIIAATIVAFVIGGAWYSPILFAKPWMRENGFTEDDHQGNLLPHVRRLRRHAAHRGLCAFTGDWRRIIDP